jgi:peptidoglycan/xylan/chitin deacetylase (PgdA/CDA1 family)
MKKTHLLAAIMYRTGFARLLDTYWGPARLTVLAYHRIAEATAPDFAYYSPNVSASPAMFARQIAYVARHFNVIDLAALQAFIQLGRALPPRPLLITFDDGYLDNYTSAYPILRQYGLPAVIFLITDWIEKPIIPWWDECAYWFHHATNTHAMLPLVGETDLTAPHQRTAARDALIRALKQVPESRKQEALQQLRSMLNVSLPENTPRLFVSWDQVRELVANGVACQPHTASHPILTRVNYAEMQRQISESRVRVEAETRQPVSAFAYPNGTPGDYDENTFEVLRNTGYAMAFTLTPGPMRSQDVRRQPLEIRRVFLSYKDTFEVFVMKVAGLPALVSGF